MTILSHLNLYTPKICDFSLYDALFESVPAILASQSHFAGTEL